MQKVTLWCLQFGLYCFDKLFLAVYSRLEKSMMTIKEAFGLSTCLQKDWLIHFMLTIVVARLSTLNDLTKKKVMLSKIWFWRCEMSIKNRTAWWNNLNCFKDEVKIYENKCVTNVSKIHFVLSFFAKLFSEGKDHELSMEVRFCISSAMGENLFWNRILMHLFSPNISKKMMYWCQKMIQWN